MPTYNLERVLFVVGEQNSGKSTQLRSMFRDIRFGTSGSIPEAPNLPEMYRLSNERCLYLRLTSPHEAGESIADFLEKTATKIEANTPHLARRWNFAGPLQPSPEKNMPDLATTCRAFVQRFKPERTRVVFLAPDRHGTHLAEVEHTALVDSLRAIPSVEILSVDARDRSANGLLLADFFDFT